MTDLTIPDGHNDDGFYSHSWRNNEVVAFGTLSSFLTQLHIVSGVVCVVCPFADGSKATSKWQ